LKYRLLLVKCAEAYESRYYSWHLLENSIGNSIVFTEFSSDVSEWFRFIWVAVGWCWSKKVVKIINGVELFFLILFLLVVGLFNLILSFLYWSILFWMRFLISSESYQFFGIISFLTIYFLSCLHLYVSHLSRLLVFWLVFWLLFLFPSVWLIVIVFIFSSFLSNFWSFLDCSSWISKLIRFTTAIS
jgi:hypothetical protein